MSIENQILERSAARCELCSSSKELAVYDVQPNDGPSLESSILLCKTCHDHILQPTHTEANHWYALNESMWSEHEAVKVLVYRVLKGLRGNPWATDLLAQLYLEDSTQAWAEAGMFRAEEGKIRVVDSNGTVLEEGDTVTLIKDLDVKGANFTAKRGTTVKNISLTDDPMLIEGRVNGTRIVLVTAYLKKA